MAHGELESPFYETNPIAALQHRHVIREQIIHWQSQYPDHMAEAVTNEVMEVYGEVAVSKVAHSECLKSLIAASCVETDLRSEAALTMALLGLLAEEAVIAPRWGKFRKKQSAA
ncbi:MAG: hypothetical protein PVJ24_06485 [Methyloceanibacter sp.]